MEKTKVCCKCNYWRKIEFGNRGECRKSNPQLFTQHYAVGHPIAETKWPITFEDDWCGEWEKKE